MGSDLERRNRYKVSLTGKSQIGFRVSRCGGGSWGEVVVEWLCSCDGVVEVVMVVMVVVIASAVAVTRARVRLGSGVQWWNDKGGCLGSGRAANQEGRGFDLRAEDFRTTLSILELPPFPNHRTFLLCVPFTT